MKPRFSARRITHAEFLLAAKQIALNRTPMDNIGDEKFAGLVGVGNDRGICIKLTRRGAKPDDFKRVIKYVTKTAREPLG